MELITESKDIQTILKIASDAGSSDVHLAPMSPIVFRVDGELVQASSYNLPPEEINTIVQSMLDDRQWQILTEKGELDFAFSFPGFTRVRANAYRQRGTYALALRILAFQIPSTNQLGIPQAVVGLTSKRRGLVLVTGATGSGKSTTLASLIDLIASKYPRNIITLEDPIEYLHHHKKAVVNQREIGLDSISYSNALRAALRQDPDVILVGEMRDLETISIALTAAETGHLVFSTLHTNSTADAIDRMIDVFSPHQQQQIRIQLASVLECVVAQQLLPRTDGGRIAAFEVLLATPAVRSLIREGKAFQLPSMIQTGKKEGMQTMDDCIFGLYMANLISKETASNYALDGPKMMQRTHGLL